MRLDAAVLRVRTLHLRTGAMLRVGFVLACILCLHRQASAQSLQGVVVDSSSVPIVAAEVTVLEINRTSTTNTMGRFLFGALAPRAYLIRVRRIGYVPRLFRIDIGPGQEWDGTIVLMGVPVILPEIETTASIPVPRFDLRPSVLIDQRHYYPRRKFDIPYSSSGASMIAGPINGDALVFFDPTPIGRRLVYQSWQSGPGGDNVGSGSLQCSKDALLVAGRLFGEEGAILVLDVRGDLFLTVRRRGSRDMSCDRFGRLALTDSVHAAAATLEEWVTLTRSGMRRAVVEGYQLAGGRLWELPLAGWATDQDLAEAHLAARDSSATLALPNWPFHWIELRAGGEVVRESSPFMGAQTLGGPASDSSSFRQWRALSVIPIVDGWVQTLVSRDSKERLLILYDRVGRPRSFTSLQGAPILIAGDPKNRQLLGVRPLRSGRRVGELVAYRY